MKKFSLLQKIRNKIRIKGRVSLDIAKSAKIAGCDISIRGENNRLEVEEGATLRKSQIEILGNNCSISIGKNCIIGHGCYISAKEGKKVVIKADCMLSRNVKLMTSDGHPIFQNERVINKGADIVIEEHVWLADNVTVLKGVNIGKNSVAGINSTVTKDIEKGSIVAGNPAKVVKTDVTWDM